MRRMRSVAPPLIRFHRTKYGTELLLDAAFVHALPTFLVDGPHTLDFHDILYVTRGRGSFSLDGERYTVAPGMAFFTLPGQVRCWDVTGLDGACLFFRDEFVTGVFNDARFLERLAYFRDRRPSAALKLGRGAGRRFLERFQTMQREIAALRRDMTDVLRAVLHETLILLSRAYVARHGEPHLAPRDAAVEKFCELVERDFPRRHRVAEYAREVGLSPGHLNARCRRVLRQTAGARIRARRILEAKRLLAHTDRSAAQIADELGFDDPAYFARFFRREAGLSPTTFRRSRR